MNKTKKTKLLNVAIESFLGLISSKKANKHCKFTAKTKKKHLSYANHGAE